MLPFVGAFGQELLHEGLVLVQMLDEEGMVRAWPLEQLLEVVRGALHGLLTALVVGGGHERALTPLLVLLLDGTVGGAFAGILVLFHLALEAVEDCSDCLFTRGMAGGDVVELLGGSRALTS